MINGMKIAFVYVGLVIGAGFASGREIFEYFNLRSRGSILPVILAFLMFFMISYIILYVDNYPLENKKIAHRDR